jgi:Transposase DDE domain group 1
MTPMKTECSAESYRFGQLNRRSVIADFSGGQITSDGGLILISEVDRYYRISEQFAACFSDQRDPSRIQHQLSDLIAQRLYGLVQGYEDLNDHEQLRHDPLFGIAVGKLESHHARCAPLAGKSTLNRLEQALHVATDLGQERYVKFTVNPEAIEHLFVQLFMAQTQTPPRQIILDLDVTDDPVHGSQEQAAFNGYYDHECYTPLLIYCGRHLLAAQLRPANVDPAAGALTQLQRIIAQIREQWKEVVILVRGDSAYSRDDILSWCEMQVNVEYVLAHASNARLRQLTAGLEQRAKAAYDEHRQQVALTLDAVGANLLQADLDALVPPQVFYQSLDYRTQNSWRCARRLVCKLTYGAQGAHLSCDNGVDLQVTKA